MTVGVDEEVPDGVTVLLLLAEPVDVFVSVGVGDVDADSIVNEVADGRGFGTFCNMGKSFSIACHTASVSQHWSSSSTSTSS